MDKLETMIVSSPTNTFKLYNKILGKGAYGIVLLSSQIRGRTEQYYAMKIIQKRMLTRIKGAYNMRQEVLFLSKIHHVNIVRMYETFEDEDYFYLVLEYCSRGSLHELLQQRGALTEAKAFKYFYQIIQGIMFMHSKGIIHRDLKMSNILLNDDDDVKICDFNWATELNDGKAEPTLCGTLDYMPPEVCSFSYHDTKLDIWSLGIILYEMVHNSLPILSHNIELSFSRYISSDLQILISNLLQLDPKKRPTLIEVLQFKWMKQYINKFKVQSTTNSGYVTPRSHSKKNSWARSEMSTMLKTEG